MYLMHAGFFWLLSVEGHPVFILVISDFRQPCNSKMAGRRAKWTKILASRVSTQCVQGTFDC